MFWDKHKKEKIICISGGADPLHLGHIKYLRDAAKFGKVIWILNSDEWLKRKKGYVLMPWEERKEVLLALRDIYRVEKVDDTQGTVNEAICRLEPDYFGKGGDRNKSNTPEQAMCKLMGIECIFGLGGDKIQSSSELVDSVVKNIIMKIGKM
jgi:D-beta-D-heptose 7-phosphate kinase/D-beta-D-heptose 1-phosphate adenosyltransferase